MKALERPWEKADYAIANEVSSYLVNFVTNGDPNGPGMTAWPRFNPSQPQTMELGVRMGAILIADKEKVSFWSRYYNSPISKNASVF